MLRYMGLMNFPRYINRESRDFFYLTLRPLIPGKRVAPRVTPAEAGEGQWVVKGLPQHGWPYAIATSWIRPESARRETKVRLLRVDPRAVRAAGERDGDDQLVIALHETLAAAPGAPSLWLGSRGFAIAPKPPDSAARHVTAGRAPGTPGPAAAAFGIDADGMLVYAEVATARDPQSDGAMLERLLRGLGAAQLMLLERPLGASIGGDRDLAGHPVARAKGGVRWLRATAPGARRIFPSTEIVAPKVWYPLQARRVRYFPKPKTDDKPEPGPTEAAPHQDANASLPKELQ
jgi:hypothetical protein